MQVAKPLGKATWQRRGGAASPFTQRPRNPPPMPPRSAEQLQLALDAPPRPEISECDVCETCTGGTCARWRQRQREWVQTWQGRPPPESEGRWGEWWKTVKTKHSRMLAATEAEQAAQAEHAKAPAAGNAAGKRRAQADGTPNKGAQRKDAPAMRDGGKGAAPSTPCSSLHRWILRRQRR